MQVGMGTLNWGQSPISMKSQGEFFDTPSVMNASTAAPTALAATPLDETGLEENIYKLFEIMVTGVSENENIFAHRQQTRRMRREKKSLGEYFVQSRRAKEFSDKTNSNALHDLEGENTTDTHKIALSAATSLLALSEALQADTVIDSGLRLNTSQWPRVGEAENVKWKTQRELDAEANSLMQHQRSNKISPPGHNKPEGAATLPDATGLKLVTVDFDISFSPGKIFNANALLSDELRIQKTCAFPAEAGNVEMQQKYVCFQENDCLVELNGMKLSALNFSEAIRMINQSNAFRILRVRREIYVPTHSPDEDGQDNKNDPAVEAFSLDGGPGEPNQIVGALNAQVKQNSGSDGGAGIQVLQDRQDKASRGRRSLVTFRRSLTKVKSIFQFSNFGQSESADDQDTSTPHYETEPKTLSENVGEDEKQDDFALETDARFIAFQPSPQVKHIWDELIGDGFQLIKHGRYGKPKVCIVSCDEQCQALWWRHKGKNYHIVPPLVSESPATARPQTKFVKNLSIRVPKERRVAWAKVREICTGQTTAKLQRRSGKKESRYLSLITSSNSIDFEARDEEERQIFYQLCREIIGHVGKVAGAAINV